MKPVFCVCIYQNFERKKRPFSSYLFSKLYILNLVQRIQIPKRIDTLQEKEEEFERFSRVFVVVVDKKTSFKKN